MINELQKILGEDVVITIHSDDRNIYLAQFDFSEEYFVWEKKIELKKKYPGSSSGYIIHPNSPEGTIFFYVKIPIKYERLLKLNKLK